MNKCIISVLVHKGHLNKIAGCCVIREQIWLFFIALVILFFFILSLYQEKAGSKRMDRSLCKTVL